MGDPRRRLLAAFASLAIATTALGFIAPPANAEQTTTTSSETTPATTPTESAAPAPTSQPSEPTTAAPEPSPAQAPTQEPAARVTEAAPEPAAAPPAPTKIRTEAIAGGPTSTGQSILAQLPLTRNVAPLYNRAYFEHWIDADGDGCDTRAEVLLEESFIPATTGPGCTVLTGQWDSRYDGASWTAASDVDIDHMVPLAEAWRSVAWSWTVEQRTAFANDLGYAHSLEAMTDSLNQSKGDKDPATWMPAVNQCDYAINWVTTKWRWNIGVDPEERTALEGYLNGTQCGTTAVALPAKMITDPSQQKYPLYKIVYDSTIFEMVPDSGGTEVPRQLSYEKWRDVYNFQTPTPAATDFVKYPWSPTVYAVTFWPGGENYWMWTGLSFAQWQTAGYPTPRNAGWIKDSYYYQWGTSSEIFVEGADGVNHKLSYQEWADSGFRNYVKRSNEGYMKLTWAPEFARMSNLSTGAGRPMGYAEWQEEAFPTPQAVQRIPGDKFYKDCGSSTIWYAGPGMNRPVSLREWQDAGSPAPTVSGNCSSPAPAPAPAPAPEPVYYANCDAVRAAGKAPLYSWQPGYRPGLDGDGNGVACQ
jgi:hypothetical protein